MRHPTTSQASFITGAPVFAINLSCFFRRVLACSLGALLSCFLPGAAYGQGALTLHLADVASAPPTGLQKIDGEGNKSDVARIDTFREEPGQRNRTWINDLSGPLYFYHKPSKTFTEYLNFNGAEGRAGLFARFVCTPGYGGGFIAFQFHPEYGNPDRPGFGVFYTLHLEDPAQAASPLPETRCTPGLDLTHYQVTPVVRAQNADPTLFQTVLIEWRDADPKDDVFTGTARELLRVEVDSHLNPMGDLLFNPLATFPTHPDYGKLYISFGDGGDGQTDQGARHPNPQSLSTLLGKILRITPEDPDGEGPLTYGIPTDNPFVSTFGARGEIWAYGFRNPHGFSWDVYSNRLIANDIGYHSWEEVNFIKKGQNYGWAIHEGAHVFDPTTGSTRSLSANDFSSGYQYPVIEYPHIATPGYPSFGEAIANGFVYRGLKFPALFGKYIFADITTGELYYADYGIMLATSDGSPQARAPYFKFAIGWDNPTEANSGSETYHRMYEIVVASQARRGIAVKDPANQVAETETGRADVRLVQTSDGEIYLTTKGDGMLRRVTGVTVSAAEPEASP